MYLFPGALRVLSDMNPLLCRQSWSGGFIDCHTQTDTAASTTMRNIYNVLGKPSSSITIKVNKSFENSSSLFQSVDLYTINIEIEAERKAENIDLQGAGVESKESQADSYSPSAPFRIGPIDYTL